MGRGEPSPGADVGSGEPSPGADVGRGEPSPGADVGRGELSPGADVGRGAQRLGDLIRTVQLIEPWRRDFPQMMAHHFITFFLIISS